MSARILNCNDSEAARYYVTRILRRNGWEVLEAGSGKEALEIARRELPEVAVLDIKLPDFDGYEVCRTLRAEPGTADMMIIQTSATFVSSEGKARGLEAGADQYLTQPFEPIELVAMVKNLLQLRSKEREARESAAALLEADKRKDEYLAMLAHELRNPLASLAVAATLLQDEPLSEHGQKLVGTVARNARHLGRLVEDLLDASRVAHGKVSLQRRPMDLAAALRRILAEDAGASAREADLHVRIGDEPIYIEGDATRIEQIVANLLGNAVKYTPAGHAISVALDDVRRDGRPMARLTIRDAGIGIAPEQLASVFELFYQADTSLARSQSGLGIGLTMVKQLVDLHDGTLHAASDGLGMGAEFRVEIPITALAVPVAQAQPAKGAPAQLSVLLVDDNADACDLWTIMLQAEGHRVRATTDPEEGLELALTAAYDAAVIDIGLPTVSGYEIAHRVRNQRSAAQPALIALTGYGRTEDKARALEAGFDAHLVKPVDCALLTATMRRVVQQRADEQSSP